MTTQGRCQVRIYTESPCPRRAEVEILGIPFCGRCARKQEAYIAIGELTHEEDFHSEPLAGALKRRRRERVGVKETMATELHHGFAGTLKPQPIALAKS